MNGPCNCHLNLFKKAFFSGATSSGRWSRYGSTSGILSGLWSNAKARGTNSALSSQLHPGRSRNSRGPSSWKEVKAKAPVHRSTSSNAPSSTQNPRLLAWFDAPSYCTESIPQMRTPRRKKGKDFRRLRSRFRNCMPGFVPCSFENVISRWWRFSWMCVFRWKSGVKVNVRLVRRLRTYKIDFQTLSLVKLLN